MTQSQEAFMKRLSVITALGAIALMANGASAQPGRAHVGKTPHATVSSYGYAGHAASPSPASEDRYQNRFESNSLGRQSFPNPDRDSSMQTTGF
jgi:hypothetical protein